MSGREIGEGVIERGPLDHEDINGGDQLRGRLGVLINFLACASTENFGR